MPRRPFLNDADRRRIPVFWAGAGLMIATFLYGIAQAVFAVVTFFWNR